MEFDSKEFGRRIVEVRTSRGITQEQLAEMAGMSRENMSRIERGLRTCSFEYLVRIASLLDISTDYLLTGVKTDKDKIRDSILSMIIQMSSMAKNL